MKKTFILVSLSLFAGVCLFLLPVISHGQSAEMQKPEMIPVSVAGKGITFQVGSDAFPNASPVHKVILTNDFSIGKTEVTNQQYADVLNYALSKGYLDKEAMVAKGNKRGEARGVSKSPQKYQDFTDEHSQITFVDGQFKPLPGKENFPVVEVTWNGAAFYANMLSEIEGLTPLYNLDDWSCQVYGKTGYRLPTEAEWEYVAQFDDGRKYPWGDAQPDQSYANIKREIKDPVEVATAAVCSLSPKGDSKLGVCDMAGNVAEFCNDWYNDSYFSPDEKIDPVGPGPSLYYYLPFFKEFRSARVVRGGSFLLDPNYRKEYGVPFMIDSVMHEQAVENSYRSYDISGFSRQVEGFRVVKTVATEKTGAIFIPGQR
ncbi:MAG TPA: SUMF1/EgtB/PvdO family nonheme iron enzyme [Candidatus Omnitrophota bacterium]|nr:SUMF1/EgtB/PvdO family nonheme iron enzyme [Candidatus Omnitrophota bacterium]HPD84844.1 SUMF1/EgtB/PvdO family nonheme iron enzyme [Candidatus Omnitrophota bacterium]HRZ03702.1 SUMF1/EgtB/PvdO family nonheme iron enzyme [Candidatus Omnitrophota bacterium]